MHYLWFDLETTGLDPWYDSILEVGLVVTNARLEELAVRRYLMHAPYRWDETAHPDVLEMHRKSGLTADLDDPFNNFHYHAPVAVERQILHVIEPYLEDGKIILAGSGVATFDLQVIKAQMPELAQRLTYYTLDIGVVRRYLQDICQVELPNLGPVSHRALDDVFHHLDEARLFRTVRHNIGRATWPEANELKLLLGAQ
jgi:oligoribonuclease